MDESWEYKTYETHWPESDESIILYSDDVTEAIGKTGMFGCSRLETSISRYVGLSAKDMADRIVDDVLKYTRDGQVDDDITLVVLKGD